MLLKILIAMLATAFLNLLVAFIAMYSDRKLTTAHCYLSFRDKNHPDKKRHQFLERVVRYAVMSGKYAMMCAVVIGIMWYCQSKM